MIAKEKVDTIMESCACFYFRKSAREVTKLYDQHLSEAGLNSSQFSTLMGVNKLGDISIGDLAQNLGLDQTTISRNIKALERDHLITFRPHQRDKRVRLVHLTPVGKQKLETAIPHWDNAQNKIEAVFANEGWPRVLTHLKKTSQAK